MEYLIGIAIFLDLVFITVVLLEYYRDKEHEKEEIDYFQRIIDENMKGNHK